MNTRIEGIKGENLAVDYLKNNGYKVIDRNFTTKLGEIDIIAEKDDYTVFIEVKSRETKKFGYPREAITRYKANKIRSVAMLFLKIKKRLNNKVRFDCVEILGDSVTHIENCF